MSKTSFRYILASSYGNDSIALIQFARERELADVAVLYNDTGWAAAWWSARVNELEVWVRSLGFTAARTSSVGMETLVKNKRGWPRSGMQFCTEELKRKPSLAWQEAHDPERKAVCLVGVRREESKERANWPEFIEGSFANGGRTLWSPLVNFSREERDALVRRAGFDPLPHRSRECSPCVNANRKDLVSLAEPEIARVERIEHELGFTQSGKPRVLFRPARKMGAVGIRQVIRWARAEPGKFKLEAVEDCDSGLCGG
jgi:hypothetical protein